MSLSNLNVQVEVQVDHSSWPIDSSDNSLCPPEIRALASSNRAISFENALLYVAICTSPPAITGFSLADLWAWLRYRPAFAKGIALKLRPEWKDIDAHQKTILSDDLGMGLSIELLVSPLQIQDIADTAHVVNVVDSGAYTLAKSGKRGPKKSPDFLLTDLDGEISVLECKGTQTSRKVLIKALSDGVAQKRNLHRTENKIFKHTLVVGAFIPQSGNRENALIQVRDPEPEDLTAVLSQTDTSTLQTAILQISLAKHLSLMGLHSWANLLATTPTAQLKQASFPDILNPPVELKDDGPTFSRSHYPPTSFGERNQINSEVAFEMVMPTEIYELLRDSSNVAEALEQIGRFRGKREWEWSQKGERSQLESPLGFVLSLEYR